jgi:hypothetical protein
MLSDCQISFNETDMNRICHSWVAGRAQPGVADPVPNLAGGNDFELINQFLS